MRRRTKEVKIRLTEEEFRRLNEKVKRAGLNRERYLRKIVDGAKVYERVPHDVWEMSCELRKIGTDLNRLAQMAFWSKYPDAKMVNDTCDRLWQLVSIMMSEFIDPENAVEIYELRKEKERNANAKE